MPKSNSWLPYAVASMPHAFSTSIAGRSSSRAEFGGEAPTLSPAATSRLLPGRASVSASNSVASAAGAADADVQVRPGGWCVGSSWPWKSVRPMMLTTL